MNFEEITGGHKAAAILCFPKKRGRPRVTRPKRDTGTPELMMKRERNETAEAIDLCLQRGLITEEQHWCGIHLRWLYTLRYGAPGVRAIDPTHLGGTELCPDDPSWRSAREEEYLTAVSKLTPGGYMPMLLGICIHNEKPSFLMHKKHTSVRAADTHTRLIMHLKEGLDILCKHWKS